MRDNMDTTRRHLLRMAAASSAASTLSTLALPAFAEAAWPKEKVIRLVVGYPAGQNADIFARRFAASMGRDLGQTIIVDNRSGANGIIGAQEVKQSRPDGYTALYATSGQMTINPALYRKLSYDPLKDFAPVGRTITGVLFLLAHPSFPANNLQELIALARAQPGKLDYGSGGQGITAHLAMELLQDAAGIKLNHIPYKGTPPAYTDLLGGQIPLMMDVGPTALPYIKAGKIKALASTGAKRAEQLPDVPTVSEQGLKGFAAEAWHALLVPAGTPPAIVDSFNASLRKTLSEPAMTELLHTAAADPSPSSANELAVFMRSAMTKWAKGVAKAGVKVE